MFGTSLAARAAERKSQLASHRPPKQFLFGFSPIGWLPTMANEPSLPFFDLGQGLSSKNVDVNHISDVCHIGQSS